MPLPPTFDARLTSARPLSPSVRGLTFEKVDGSPFVFDAGQWVNLVLPLPGGDARRAYSIASAPDGSPRFELAVTHVKTGPGSSFLHALSPGEVVRAEGPQGFFTRSLGAEPPALFVCTGTGFTPLRSMLLDAVARGRTTPLWLLFGARCEEEILYRDELAALARAYPHLRVEATLSRPAESWAGRRGYVQTHVRELHGALASAAGASPHVFVCGLERMVGAVRELVRKEMGLPRQSVHSERYD